VKTLLYLCIKFSLFGGIRCLFVDGFDAADVVLVEVVCEHGVSFAEILAGTFEGPVFGNRIHCLYILPMLVSPEHKHTYIAIINHHVWAHILPSLGVLYYSNLPHRHPWPLKLPKVSTFQLNSFSSISSNTSTKEIFLTTSKIHTNRQSGSTVHLTIIQSLNTGITMTDSKYGIWGAKPVSEKYGKATTLNVMD